MSKKRGLGKPLNALLGSNSVFGNDAADNDVSENLCQLPTEMIQPGKYQPRRAMDEEALEDLANSIRQQGVIQPIVVRRVIGGRYEIIAGERRWRASQLAGLTQIPALIKDIPDEAAVAIALIENIQRENLNPVEEAIALQRLLDEFSLTHQQVAEAVGKSRTAVTNLLRLLTLCDEVREMLERGELEMGHARALLPLSEALQIEASHQIITKKLSAREAEELAKRLQTPKIPDPMKIIDPDIQRLQDDLTARFKLPVTVRSSLSGRGKIEIRYKNLRELDAFLEYFVQ